VDKTGHNEYVILETKRPVVVRFVCSQDCEDVNSCLLGCDVSQVATSISEEHSASTVRAED
jgi:hypothetical protein